MNGIQSSEVHSISDVPQGSVFGPLLFLLHINNVINLPLSPGTQLLMILATITRKALKCKTLGAIPACALLDPHAGRHLMGGTTLLLSEEACL